MLLPMKLPATPRAFRTGTNQRMLEAIGVMDTLGIARDLGADDASRVAVVLCAAHAPYGALIENFDIECAS